MRDKEGKKERQNPHTQNRRMRHPNLSGGSVYGPPAVHPTLGCASPDSPNNSVRNRRTTEALTTLTIEPFL